MADTDRQAGRLSAAGGTLRCVRPALKPGLIAVWRDRDTLQIGIDPRRGVALTGMRAASWLIGLLDGSRDRAQVITAATERGMSEQQAEHVLALLAAAGLLDDFPAHTLRAISRQERTRLAPELAAAALASKDTDGGARTLARRRCAHVLVYGRGRPAADIAQLLTTAGVGQVAQADPRQGVHAAAEPVPEPATRRAARAAPGQAADAARGRAADAAPSCAAGTRGRPSHPLRAGNPALPDLAVLTGFQVPDVPARLMRDRVPHLAASAAEAIGAVGPLVLPGRSACLRCLDMMRAERDPAWPLILAQLAGQQPDPVACDAPLAAAVAAQAASQALAFIDRPGASAAVLDGTLELVLPSWQWRRRSWPPQPRCGCGAYAAAMAAAATPGR